MIYYIKQGAASRRGLASNKSTLRARVIQRHETYEVQYNKYRSTIASSEEKDRSPFLTDDIGIRNPSKTYFRKRKYRIVRASMSGSLTGYRGCIVKQNLSVTLRYLLPAKLIACYQLSRYSGKE
jgi:hypothetical protein